MPHRARSVAFILSAGAALTSNACMAQNTELVSLLDGSASAWRGYLKADLPAGWQVIDGALTRVAAAGDIITREEFEDFELVLEWKVAPGGNSGIFFHVREDASLSHAYLSGPEMQVLDNEGHADGRDPLTSAGSNFALHAPVRDVTKKAGEWNEARLVVNGSHVEHWLNGVKLLEYELGSEEWSQSVANSKFKDMPEYGKARRGHIALQDHGDWVAFRNISIRHN
jgi:hypothetical protein